MSAPTVTASPNASTHNDFFTKNFKFLMKDTWAWLNLIFAVAGLVATTIVIAINYLTTYEGFIELEFGPIGEIEGIEYRVLIAFTFMLFMQAYEFIYPVGDTLGFFQDAPDFQRYFRRLWKVVLLLDFATALVFLSGGKWLFDTNQIEFGLSASAAISSVTYIVGYIIVLVPYALGALFFVAAELFWWWALRVGLDRWAFARKTGKYAPVTPPAGQFNFRPTQPTTAPAPAQPTAPTTPAVPGH